jgi:hypothetical protein
MAGACECCNEPIKALGIEIQQQAGDADDTTDPYLTATAWASAVALIPDFDDDSWDAYGLQASILTSYPSLFLAVAGGLKELHGSDAHAQAIRAKYRFRFYAATCYLKVYWNEVLRHTNHSGTDEVVSTTPQSWEWTTPTAVDGLCLPADFNTADSDTWVISDEFELAEVEPINVTLSGDFENQSYFLTDFSWSYINGYVPPSDGSANGFPPAV